MKKLIASLTLFIGGALLPFVFVYAATNPCGGSNIAVDMGNGTTQCTDASGASFTVQNSTGQVTGGVQSNGTQVNAAGTPVTQTTPTPTQTNSTITPCGTNCNLGYTPLEPIQGLTTGSTYDPTTSAGFAKLISTIFTVLISVGALMSVLSLTIGGVQYMVSGSAALKGKAIGRVQASIWGIVLIAGIWLILNTINPNLLKFNFNPCPVGSNTATCAAMNYNYAVTTSAPTNVQQVALSQDQISQAGLAGKTQDNTALLYDPNSSNLPSGSAIQTYNSGCTAKGGIPGTATVGTQSAFYCESQAAYNSSTHYDNATPQP